MVESTQSRETNGRNVKMTTAKKPELQQSCDVAKLINTIEKAALAAMAIYSALEPIVRAILTNAGKKTK